MSAKFDTKSGHIYLAKGRLDPYSELYIENMFDQTVDYDSQDILFEREQTKAAKKVALCKVLTFPLEFTLLRVFAGKLYSDAIAKENNIYWKLIRNKLNFEQFTVELSKLTGY